MALKKYININISFREFSNEITYNYIREGETKLYELYLELFNFEITSIFNSKDGDKIDVLEDLLEKYNDRKANLFDYFISDKLFSVLNKNDKNMFIKEIKLVYPQLDSFFEEIINFITNIQTKVNFSIKSVEELFLKYNKYLEYNKVNENIYLKKKYSNLLKLGFFYITNQNNLLKNRESANSLLNRFTKILNLNTNSFIKQKNSINNEYKKIPSNNKVLLAKFQKKVYIEKEFQQFLLEFNDFAFNNNKNI